MSKSNSAQFCDHPGTHDLVQTGEWRFVISITIAILVVTSAPYLFAVLSTPPERHFMGFILNISDHAQYLSWYKAFQTNLLISNRLTPEPNPPIFFNLLWWSLGRLGSYSRLSYAVVYQIFRWLAGAFFLAMVYAFAALAFASVRQRRTAFLVIALGSGLGWFLVLLKYTLTRGTLLFPLDIYVAEGNSFLCVMAYPHFAEAAGLILAVIWLLLKGYQQGKLQYAVYAGLVALLLGWQHTYDLIIVWGVPIAYAGVLWLLTRKWPAYWFKAMLIVGLFSWPPALYSMLLTRLDPTWKEVLAQFANAGVYSPLPHHMLILMGVPLVAAIATLLKLLYDRWAKRPVVSLSSPELELFIGVWFVVGWLLTYVPTDFQIHMINSWQVPVGLWATRGLFDYVIPALKRQRQADKLARQMILALLALSVPTNIYLWAWRLVDLNRHDYPFYLYRDEVAAIRWLEEHAPPDSIVLSAENTGQYIPGLSGQRAFLAHWAQTVDYYDKKRMVQEFFANSTSDAQRQQILEQYAVDYILYGPTEQALGNDTLDSSTLTTLAFSAPQVKLYAVKK